MDRKTANVLNSVTRELFEIGGPAVSTSTPVEVDDYGPITADTLYPSYQKMEDERNAPFLAAQKVGQAASDVADHFKEAQAIRNQIAIDKVSRAIGDVADKFRDERNEAISRGASPDVQMSLPYSRDYGGFISRSANDAAEALADAAEEAKVAEAAKPWYQKGLDWADKNRLATAGILAGVPTALTAAYIFNKRRKKK